MTREQAKIIIEALAQRYARCQDDVEESTVRESYVALLMQLPMHLGRLIDDVALELDLELDG